MTTTRTAHAPARRVVSQPATLRALSGRELLAAAERHDATGWQDGLNAVHDEAERRAASQSADSLAAQLAGYLGLPAEDSEHALADEAHAWGVALRRMLPHPTSYLPAQVDGWQVER